MKAVAQQRSHFSQDVNQIACNTMGCNGSQRAMYAHLSSMEAVASSSVVMHLV